MANDLPYSQACENNKTPILEKLREIFDAPGLVLEIGTGTGQHAEHFAMAIPFLQWQPTDHPNVVDTCRPRFKQVALSNILPVVELDVGANWPIDSIQWAFSANTAHIMSWPEVQQMFLGIGKRLAKEGAFCLYGPFNQQGHYSSDSNRQFDLHLRAKAPHMGIRDLDDLMDLAHTARLCLVDNFAMPANNRLLVFRPIAK